LADAPATVFTSLDAKPIDSGDLLSWGFQERFNSIPVTAERVARANDTGKFDSKQTISLNSTSCTDCHAFTA